MSDTIFVNGLLVHAHHGVIAHEEQVGQRFVRSWRRYRPGSKWSGGRIQSRVH